MYIKIGKKQWLVLQKLEHWRRTLVFCCWFLLFFCWLYKKKFVLSRHREWQMYVLCVNDWYFRSTSWPFATINIFAQRICLQFFRYFQWNSTQFCDNWTFVVVSCRSFIHSVYSFWVCRISPLIRCYFFCAFWWTHIDFLSKEMGFNLTILST